MIRTRLSAYAANGPSTRTSAPPTFGVYFGRSASPANSSAVASAPPTDSWSGTSRGSKANPVSPAVAPQVHRFEGDAAGVDHVAVAERRHVGGPTAEVGTHRVEEGGQPLGRAPASPPIERLALEVAIEEQRRLAAVDERRVRLVDVHVRVAFGLNLAGQSRVVGVPVGERDCVHVGEPEPVLGETGL